MLNIYNYSNPDIVNQKAKQYLGKNVIIRFSEKPPNKYMVLNTHTNKWVDFRLMPYEDLQNIKT